MLEIKNILCPVDFSDSSQPAIKYAVAIARKFNAKIYIMYVADIDDLSYDDETLIEGDHLGSEKAKEEKAKLINTIPENIRNQVEIETIILAGVPFDEIVNFAAESKVDIIIMGTHGRTGLKHVLMGSISEKVVGKSTCPVLLIKHDYPMPENI